MPQCEGITLKGTRCSYQGKYGKRQEYCHHHCIPYFQGLQLEKQDHINIQNDIIKGQDQKLRNLLSQNSEASKVLDQLLIAVKEKDNYQKQLNDINSQLESVKNIIIEENQKTRDTVKEDGDLTRDITVDGITRLGHMGSTILHELRSKSSQDERMIQLLEKLYEVKDSNSSKLEYTNSEDNRKKNIIEGRKRKRFFGLL